MPAVWLIDPYRAGERNQVLALAEALGWPFLVKRLSYKKYEFLTNIVCSSSLRGINLKLSDSLIGPWPDLVISSGMRNEPVCRWIQNQSGGRTRIVHVGNPWADPSRFDLVITTPQYRIPVRDNVLQNALTLNNLDTDKLQIESANWEAAFVGLPRPYTAVVVGGNSGPFTLGPKAADRLVKLSEDLRTLNGGSVLLTTSARTPLAAAEILEAGIETPRYIYRWRQGGERNPYLGMLACADHIIVTGDSISMLSEACATGKPVYMFDLGVGEYAMQPEVEGRRFENDWRLGGIMYRLLMRFIWQKVSRDICLVHQHLLKSGRASWLPRGSFGSSHSTVEMAAAVSAVKKLFD